MQQRTSRTYPMTIGLDLGNKSTQCAVLDEDGQRVEKRAVTTNHEQLTALFNRAPGGADSDLRR